MTSHKQRLQKCLLFIALGYVLQPACSFAAGETEVVVKKDNEVAVENDTEKKAEGEVKTETETAGDVTAGGDVAVEVDRVDEAKAAEEVVAKDESDADSETKAGASIDANSAAEGGTAIDSESYPWIENSRRYIGKSVKAINASVDSYLSNDPTFTANDSFLRLRLSRVFEEGGHSHPNNGIKLRVDLPKTEHKWSLVFETDPDEMNTLEEQKQASKGNEQAFQTTDGSIGAIKFILNDWRNWKSDFDVGVKMPLPPNTFVRFNNKRHYQLDKNWDANIKHSIYYFREEGLGDHITVVFSRPLSVDWTFFNAVDQRWKDKEAILEYADIITFQHLYSERDSFLYRTGVFYQDHPRSYLQSYFVDMIYRRRLHSHWLYGEIIPSVTWPETEDFNDMAAVAFSLEVVFD